MIFVDTRQNKSLCILIKIIWVAISLSKKIEKQKWRLFRIGGFCWEGYVHNEKHRKMYISYKVCTYRFLLF